MRYVSVWYPCLDTKGPIAHTICTHCIQLGHVVCTVLIPRKNFRDRSEEGTLVATMVFSTKSKKGLLDAHVATDVLNELDGDYMQCRWPSAPGGMPPDIGVELQYAQQHTIDHVNCPACEAADYALRGVEKDLAKMTFREASSHWIALRKMDEVLKSRTHEADKTYINALMKFFANIRLCDITPGHVRAYQSARTMNVLMIGDDVTNPWAKGCKPGTVNHELSVLAQMLTHCKLWHRIKPFYFLLKTPRWSPRVIMTRQEEDIFWSRAMLDPDAALAYWVGTITANTTAAGIELRGLRLGNLHLPDSGIAEIYIPEDSVKNNSRPRKISLNTSARWGVEQCLKRALYLGSSDPAHYLFPFRVKRNNFDPTRPASRSFLRKPWDRLRAVTGFPHLTPHDLRHHCITRLLENGVEPETVRAIAGHVTEKMTAYYAHHRAEVRLSAVNKINTLSSAPTKGGFRAG